MKTFPGGLIRHLPYGVRAKRRIHFPIASGDGLSESQVAGIQAGSTSAGNPAMSDKRRRRALSTFAAF
jgi:hypothetical protein